MVKGSEGSGTALQGARALFMSAEAAEKAFLALSAESIEVDKVGDLDLSCLLVYVLVLVLELRDALAD